MALPIPGMRVIMCSVASALVLAGSSSRLSAQPPSSPRIAADPDVASSGGGPAGEIVRFVEANGRVTRMITGDSYVERVQP